ncbi:hypothetical protein SISNIDRAFT_471061 [Sistotremastrum niveocremeum HHB9708]|uniref:Peptidase C14 caspase domain-containing protein n=1 Tax=Sistotremastrum niveocremeum HHB9708 TaxID=1314777 RepID=A0A164N3B4_9AGAM|nr:hypothetical protein SISNIDRAFT_471061 [Sistotremastrum niveocremeum HHB9708]
MPNLSTEPKNEPRTMSALHLSTLASKEKEQVPATSANVPFHPLLSSKSIIPSLSNPLSNRFSHHSFANHPQPPFPLNHTASEKVAKNGIWRSHSAQDLSSLIRARDRGDSWSSEYSNVSNVSNASNRSGSIFDGEIGVEVRPATPYSDSASPISPGRTSSIYSEPYFTSASSYFSPFPPSSGNPTTTTYVSHHPNLVNSPLSLSRYKRPPHRKALLIGINYRLYKTRYRHLPGTHEDVYEVHKFMQKRWNLPNSAVTLLSDAHDALPHQIPTAQNIISEMEKLVEDAIPGDHLFVYFGGHGEQLPDKDGDEDDELDEAIVSCDGRLITDDDMHDILIRPLPPGCRLTALFDCCHSGTVLDLPYNIPTSFHASSRSPSPSLSLHLSEPPIPHPKSPKPAYTTTLVSSPDLDELIDLPHGTRLTPEFMSSPLLGGNLSTLPPLPSSPDSYFPSILDTDRDRGRSGPRVRPRPRPRRKWSSGNAVLWSSCLDHEESQEVIDGAVNRGAMTYAFILCMESEGFKADPTHRRLLHMIRYNLAKWKCVQSAQLSSSQELSIDTHFEL